MIGDVCSHPATQCMSKKLLVDYSKSKIGPNFLRMFQSMERMQPLRDLVGNSNGRLNYDDVDALVEEANKLARGA
ncbi:hypothetical protein NESM_000660800 [Novymonas esmeraldas]|uniref:Uncharacterized protein n=1 Tax=Novymonas esmeraldas TaxID=1808958 RepID=A0AAW0EVJ2_9TRYP